MLIKEIDIIAFGKLRNKKISLKDGLNVIYGKNESGKTTIHSFIGGMLYGFLKPGVKSTIYNPDHSKYTPWFGEAYGGRLTLIKDGVGYIIERSFVKGREETRIIDEATGEDVTSQMKLGPSGRIAQPGYQFIGVSSSVFNNTIYVGQRAIDTNSRLAEEMRDRMINAAESGDGSISVDKALKFLDKKSAEIGTNRNSRSWYGQLSRKINEIDDRLNELNEIKNRYDSASIQRQELSTKLDIKADRYNYLKLMSYHIRDNKIRDIKEKINLISGEIKELELKCLDIEPYSVLRDEDLEECHRLDSDIRISKDRISGLDEQWGAFQDQLTRLLDNKKRTAEFEQIIEDGYRAGSLESAAEYSTKETIEKEIKDLEAKKRVTTILSAAAGSIYIIGCGVLLMTRNFSSLLFIQPMIIASLIFYYSTHKSAKAIARHNEKQRQVAELKSASIELNGLRRLELEQSMLAIQERRKQQLSELLILERQLSDILLRNGMADTSEFKNGIRYKVLYSKMKDEISNKLLQLKALEREIEILPKEWDEISDPYNEVLSLDYDEEGILKEISQLDEELKILHMDIKELDGRINAYEESLGDKIELEEERDLCRGKLAELEIEKKAIDLASSRIKVLSAELHRDFAPILNKEVSKAMRILTAGAYNNAKIDQMLSARVLDDSTGRLLNLEDLSGGTADQLYLALRLGVLKGMIPHNVPLFLDECFQQYDSGRLETSLSLIIEEARERQILLFTSHEREMYLLDKLEKSYNLIELI